MEVNTELSDADLADRLHNCQSMLDGILQNIQSLFFVQDLEGRYLLTNSQCEKEFNISHDKIQGKTNYDIFPKETADIFRRNNLRVIETNKPCFLEEKVPRGDSIHTYRTVLYPLRNQDGAVNALCGITTDITEHVQAKESLQIIFDSAADGIMLSNIESERFNSVNNAICRMLGYSEEEFKQLSVSDIHPAESLEYVRNQLSKQISGEILLAPDIPIKRKDGTVFIANISASAINVYGCPHLLGIVRDITKRKQAEAERKLLISANEQTCEIIIITDREGTIQYVNPAFTTITGYTEQEAIGKNPRILASGRQTSEFYGEMWKTLMLGEVWNGRFVNKKKDGSLYTEEATITPMRGESGDIANFVSVKRDITNEIEAEQQLRQAQKMEAVGQLAGGVAHDFNNLLHVIQGYSDLMMMDATIGSPNYQKIEGIQDAAKKAAILTRQLLTFSRRQVIKPEDHDLNILISGILEMLHRLIGENITLKFIKSDSLESICVDQIQIEQMLINLCVNARDAMPDGGGITVETKKSIIDDKYAQMHLWSRSGHFIELSVSDTGCGIAKELMDRIFDPFFTTKEMGKGTGLGLATVFGIVKHHKGFMNVCSKVGVGTIFSIYLPVVERKPIKKIKLPSLKIDGGSETILIAEDDKDVLNLAKLILDSAGYTVITACDGCELIEVFEKNATKIDLIITDVLMPKMSGQNAMECILKKHPNVPHIYASGYSENALHANFIQHTTINLLQKPYGVNTLLKSVRDVLDAPREKGEAVGSQSSG